MKERMGRIGEQGLAPRGIVTGKRGRIEPRGAGRGQDLAVVDIDHHDRASRRLRALIGLQGHALQWRCPTVLRPFAASAGRS